jgi:Ca2+-binding RTX toxin-like protein
MARIKGTNKSETLTGTAAADVILGLGGNDILKGGAGNDTLDGGNGKDKLFGGLGNDKLIGGAGIDTLSGDQGNDTLAGGAGADVLKGGAGLHDVADYAASSAGIFVGLGVGASGIGGDALGDTLFGIEDVIGTQFSDLIFGDGNANTLLGGLDDDLLNGGLGRDVLNGGADDDTLKGGGGVDVLTGATGQDKFQFADYLLDRSNVESGIGAGNRDIITDFRQGFDKIDLSSIDSSLGLGGAVNEDFLFNGTGAFFAHATFNGQVRFDIIGGNTIIQIDREGDGDSTADFEIQLNGAITLTAADFIL